AMSRHDTPRGAKGLPPWVLGRHEDDERLEGATCETCRGSRRIRCACVGGDHRPMLVCEECRGTGWVVCPDCAGREP
ncbi:MAG: hypothetical protein ABII82_02185, partial [Verrucomicrobiota bacterium]